MREKGNRSRKRAVGEGIAGGTTLTRLAPLPLPHCGRRGLQRRLAYAVAFGQVVLIQLAAAVDSLWVVPGLGQPIGAVMLRIGIVMMRSGSQAANSYCGRFLLNPVTASLYAWGSGRMYR